MLFIAFLYFDNQSGKTTLYIILHPAIMNEYFYIRLHTLNLNMSVRAYAKERRLHFCPSFLCDT